jgi:hypothetical protein
MLDELMPGQITLFNRRLTHLANTVSYCSLCRDRSKRSP